jgi:hypothetical protein
VSAVDHPWVLVGVTITVVPDNVAVAGTARAIATIVVRKKAKNHFVFDFI